MYILYQFCVCSFLLTRDYFCPCFYDDGSFINDTFDHNPVFGNSIAYTLNREGGNHAKLNCHLFVTVFPETIFISSFSTFNKMTTRAIIRI